jgi:hypothetical protein
MNFLTCGDSVYPRAPVAETQQARPHSFPLSQAGVRALFLFPSLPVEFFVDFAEMLVSYVGVDLGCCNV